MVTAARIGAVVIVVVLTGCASAARASVSRKASVRTARSSTTTNTIRAVRQPAVVTLPTPPSGGISWGTSGAVVLAYERRLRQLHFDPGPLDGVYGQDTQYAITAVDKLFGLDRDGEINVAVQQALEHFTYRPALPTAEGARVEVDLDAQVLTVYRDWQPVLITTASTGSGQYFCGGSDGCQYAITPAGHFRFQTLHRGWDEGKLGRMWNPYYFNGGIAVHGLASVPAAPASHGCVRIPMDIANYFPTLVDDGEAIYVLGNAMKPGNGYVGPTTTTANPTTTTVPAPATTAQTNTTTVPPTATSAPPALTTVPTTPPHPTTTMKRP